MNELTVDPYSFMLPFYDRWSAHMTEDVPFYVEQGRAAAGPVVELGAGNGRVTIPMAAAGVKVTAVDVSDAMLTDAARRADIEGVAARITFVRADMRTFVADPPVAMVAIPFRSFMHNLTTEDQLATLTCVHRSLMPGGKLVMNMFTVDPEIVVTNEGRARIQAEYVDERGRRCELWATSFYEAGTQLLDVQAELRVFEGEQFVSADDSTLRLRTIGRYEFEHLLARAAFEVEALYGGFDKRPYGPGPDEMVWIARKR